MSAPRSDILELVIWICVAVAVLIFALAGIERFFGPPGVVVGIALAVGYGWWEVRHA